MGQLEARGEQRACAWVELAKQTALRGSSPAALFGAPCLGSCHAAPAVPQVVALRLRSAARADAPLPSPEAEMDYPTTLNRALPLVGGCHGMGVRALLLRAAPGCAALGAPARWKSCWPAGTQRFWVGPAAVVLLRGSWRQCRRSGVKGDAGEEISPLGACSSAQSRGKKLGQHPPPSTAPRPRRTSESQGGRPSPRISAPGGRVGVAALWDGPASAAALRRLRPATASLGAIGMLPATARRRYQKRWLGCAEACTCCIMPLCPTERPSLSLG